MIVVPQWLKDWLKESLQRLKMKRPKYFLYLSRFGDILSMIAGIPYVLKQAEHILYELGVNFAFPGFVTALSNKLAFGIGIGFSLAARLTVKTPVVGVTLEGAKIQVTDVVKMPFTDKADKKEIEKSDTPPPLMPDVSEKPTTPDV